MRLARTGVYDGCWEWHIENPSDDLLRDLNSVGWPYSHGPNHLFFCEYNIPTETVLELTEAEFVGAEPQNMDTSEVTWVRDAQVRDAAHDLYKARKALVAGIDDHDEVFPPDLGAARVAISRAEGKEEA